MPQRLPRGAARPAPLLGGGQGEGRERSRAGKRGAGPGRAGPPAFVGTRGGAGAVRGPVKRIYFPERDRGGFGSRRLAGGGWEEERGRGAVPG